MSRVFINTFNGNYINVNHIIVLFVSSTVNSRTNEIEFIVKAETKDGTQFQLSDITHRAEDAIADIIEIAKKIAEKIIEI